MQFTLPSLPYTANALEPLMSANTLAYHYGKHLATYINNLNELIKTSPLDHEASSLEEVVLRAEGALYNNAAQAWNHIFFFNQLSPTPQMEPTGKLQAALVRDFGSTEVFKEQFTQAAIKLFGSGWVWLVADDEDRLSILSMSNAGNPATEGLRPVMTVDVWEHAYYLDHQNRRADFMKNFWALIDWKFTEEHF